MDGVNDSAEVSRLEDLRNEVLRKIGRNMILFQDLERLLKFLAARLRLSGTGSQLKAIFQDQLDEFSGKTLGQVAAEIRRNLYADMVETPPTQRPLFETHVSFSFSIENTEQLDQESNATLAALVKERNDLVHHLLQRWNLRSIESSEAISRELDEQRLRVVPEIHKYKAICDGLQELRKELQQAVDQMPT